jgi:hypothetical protein
MTPRHSPRLLAVMQAPTPALSHSWWPALAVALTLTLAAPVAAATTIWRCGPDGRQFQAEPCDGGRPIEALAPRPAADLKAAQARLQRETAQAAALQQQRLRAAAGQRPAQAAGIGHPGLASGRADATAEPRRAPRDGLTTPKKPRLNRPDAVAGTWRAVAPSSR